MKNNNVEYIYIPVEEVEILKSAPKSGIDIWLDHEMTMENSVIEFKAREIHKRKKARDRRKKRTLKYKLDKAISRIKASLF